MGPNFETQQCPLIMISQEVQQSYRLLQHYLKSEAKQRRHELTCPALPVVDYRIKQSVQKVILSMSAMSSFFGLPITVSGLAFGVLSELHISTRTQLYLFAQCFYCLVRQLTLWPRVRHQGVLSTAIFLVLLVLLNFPDKQHSHFPYSFL